MNKLILISAVVLVGITACGKKEKVKENSTPKVVARDMKGLKIAFYNSDSLKTTFEYFKKEEAIVTKKQIAFQKEVERRSKAYQSFIVNNNARLNEMSETERAQIQQRAQQMESELMQYQQNEGARLEKEAMEKMETISRKIEVFGKQFSEKNNIDILLIHGAGGQINFINSAMDVSKEFSAFLNEQQAEIENDIKK